MNRREMIATMCSGVAIAALPVTVHGGSLPPEYTWTRLKCCVYQPSSPSRRFPFTPIPNIVEYQLFRGDTLIGQFDDTVYPSIGISAVAWKGASDNDIEYFRSFVEQLAETSRRCVHFQVLEKHHRPRLTLKKMADVTTPVSVDEIASRNASV